MRLGYISGVFDCLHDGHKFLLKEARKYCDYLYVSINDDNYIRSKKGREPFHNQEERKKNLMDSGLVDHVEIRESPSPLKVILTLKPDVIFVGDDYRIENVVGYPECREWNGEICIIERIKGISTTEILKRLRL